MVSQTYCFRPFFSVGFLCFALLLQACTPVGAALTVGATAGSIALEERSLEDSVNDRAIQLAINKKLADISLDLFSAVNIDAVEGRVLLTGIVKDKDDRLTVTKTAWSAENVKDVINEIMIGDQEELLASSRDAWIRTKLQATFTLDADIRAVNYSVESVAGRVYLFGIAANEAELTKAISHAREISYVRKVISHMIFKDDPRRVKNVSGS